MAEKQEIQYINPVDLTLIAYDGVRFKETQYQSRLKSVSRVLYEHVIIYSFKIPASQKQDDLNSLVEIKMYEEAGLDVNKNYKITYIVKALDFDESNLIEAFAIDQDILREYFKGAVKKVKYIDFLALPFFAFTTFYTNKILTGKNDIFVYLSEQESFMSFYKDGAYISTKSQINITEIIEKLKANDIDLSVDAFYELLKNKGLDATQYEPQERELFNLIESIFSQILTKIQNVAMHNRSVFDFDTIDRIFLSTPQGRIRGLKEFVLTFGLSDTNVLDFNLFKEKQTHHFLDNVVASYGQDNIIAHSDGQNATIFTRKPSFLKTRTGKLFMSVMLVFIMMLVAYEYLAMSIASLRQKEEVLSAQHQTTKRVLNQYKTAIKKQNALIVKEQEAIAKQHNVMSHIQNSIETLENLRGKDQGYVSFLTQVNALLKRFGLHAKSIQQINKHMKIEVISSYTNRDEIAKFLRALIHEGFVNVSTDEIKLDEKNYISKIGIERE
ncbi:hypothetical protein [Sulfurospirillum sp. 1612]|uniref:hypothetical protein n=1 Tax=Sulfurospirillum sp. 1612 TaxID=3094835 RepID=UPI002F94789B